MKLNRYLITLLLVIFLAVSLVGCHPKVDMMAKAEKVFVKMVDHTAAKLDLTGRPEDPIGAAQTRTSVKTSRTAKSRRRRPC